MESKVHLELLLLARPRGHRFNVASRQEKNERGKSKQSHATRYAAQPEKFPLLQGGEAGERFGGPTRLIQNVQMADFFVGLADRAAIQAPSTAVDHAG